MSIPRVYRVEDIENAVEAIRMAYNAALLAPDHWAKDPFDMALDCVLQAFGVVDEDHAPEMQEVIEKQVKRFLRGGEGVIQEVRDHSAQLIREDQAHELGDNRPTLDAMEY